MLRRSHARAVVIKMEGVHMKRSARKVCFKFGKDGHETLIHAARTTVVKILERKGS